MYIADSYLEQIIREDVPDIDLTTHLLGIGDRQGCIEYFTRDAALLCGTEEAERIYRMLGAERVEIEPSGTRLSPGDVFMRVWGRAEVLHMGWKCCLNIFEYYSALATKTRAMVEAAHEGNPRCEVLTTRKRMPGTKPLGTKALLVGGSFPHRLGLSETVLIFAQHVAFYEGGIDGLVADIPQIKARCCEKKLFVEADASDAPCFAEAGVDGIQLDKVPVDELAPLVRTLKDINGQVTVIAAGGVNLDNARAYAATGVDGIATTCLHFAKPLDMSARMVEQG
ncbi:MAG: ModD protein [Coriobacteriales bacterium]